MARDKSKRDEAAAGTGEKTEGATDGPDDQSSPANDANSPGEVGNQSNGTEAGEEPGKDGEKETSEKDLEEFGTKALVRHWSSNVMHRKPLSIS